MWAYVASAISTMRGSRGETGGLDPLKKYKIRVS